MASIYRKSAPRRLAWPRYTVNQLRAGLHGPDIPYISLAQACMAPIYSISAPRRLAWPRFTVNQLHAGLHGPVEHFASVKQACRTSSKSSPASSRLAWPCRSLRQYQTGMAFVSRGAIGGGGQSWGREGGLYAGIYLCPRFKPKKKQIYEQFDLPIPESGK